MNNNVNQLDQALMEIEIEIHNVIQMIEQPADRDCGHNNALARIAMLSRYEALICARNILVRIKNKGIDV